MNFFSRFRTGHSRQSVKKKWLLDLLLSGIEFILIGRTAFTFVIRAAALDQHFDPGSKLPVLVYFRAQVFVGRPRAIETEKIKVGAIKMLVF